MADDALRFREMHPNENERPSSLQAMDMARRSASKSVVGVNPAYTLL